MTDHPQTDEERRFASLLRSELEVAIGPFDPAVVARGAMNERRRPMLRMALAAATVAAAVVATLVGIQVLGQGPSTGGGPEPTATADARTKGPIPDSAWQEDGTIDMSQVPDFIPATNGDGIAGWISSDDALPPDGTKSPDEIPVFADDLRTLVGHMFPGVGFVPLGTDPPLPPPVEDLSVLVRNDSDRVAILEITEAPDKVDHRAQIIAPLISLEPGEERQVRLEAPRDRWSLRLRDGDGGFFFSSDLERWSRALSGGSLAEFYFVVTPEGVLEVVTE